MYSLIPPSLPPSLCFPKSKVGVYWNLLIPLQIFISVKSQLQVALAVSWAVRCLLGYSLSPGLFAVSCAVRCLLGCSLSPGLFAVSCAVRCLLGCSLSPGLFAVSLFPGLFAVSWAIRCLLGYSLSPGLFAVSLFPGLFAASLLAWAVHVGCLLSPGKLSSTCRKQIQHTT